MKSLYKIVAVVGLSFMATSCFDKAKPNYQFFPSHDNVDITVGGVAQIEKYQWTKKQL